MNDERKGGLPMKKGLIFSLMTALLFWAISSWAWYPEQEKDGIKDTVSPEEAKRLMREGTFGMRKDYEPQPGFPWLKDIEKGTLKAEQIMYLDLRNSQEWGFYSHVWWRSSIYMNSRGRYSGSSGIIYRYFDYNEGRKIEDGDNFADTLSYHEGKFNEGDVYKRHFIGPRYYPPEEVGTQFLELIYVKTPKVYKETDRWKYFPGRRKVLRLGAASKAQLIGSGIATFDDIGSRMVWEHAHKIIGTDVLKPEDFWFGTYGFWESPTSTKRKVYIKQPIECWVIESIARDPGYYLGKIIYWIRKSKDPNKIVRVREEQYDRAMNLWKIWEYLWSPEPNPEDGEYSELCMETWDLRRDFRDEVVHMDGYAPRHNVIPWKERGSKEYFFSLDNMRSEQFWFPVPDTKLRRKRFGVWKKTNPPKLLRNRFPEHRKIVLRKEIEEKIRKLVEKGIFE